MRNDINIKVNEIHKETGNIKIIVAKMEQHLKDINGTIMRHEKDLNRMDKDIVSNKVNQAKMAGYGGLSGGIAGTVIYVALKLIWI